MFGSFTGHAFCIMAWLWRLEWIRWRRQGSIRGYSVCSTYFSIQNGCPIDWEVDITRNITMSRTPLLSALDLIASFSLHETTSTPSFLITSSHLLRMSIERLFSLTHFNRISKHRIRTSSRHRNEQISRIRINSSPIRHWK